MATKLMTLQEAADQLGLHYMTVYRYVRTGRLPGVKDGVEWRVKASDVEKLAEAGEAPRRGRGRRSADYAGRLRATLVDGDAAGAWTVVENAMAAGLEPADVYRDLFMPTLQSIGAGWEAGEITVAQEHQASSVVTSLVGRLGPQFTRRGRKRGSVVVGTPAGDEHALPVAMVADLLRGVGFRVYSLGGNVPAESFVETAEQAERLVAVAICATSTGNDRAIRQAIRAVREAVDVPIYLGGGAVTDKATAARLGADASARTSTELMDALISTASEGSAPEEVAV